MTAELGHQPGRVYGAQDGSTHFNGGNVYDSDEAALAQKLTFTPATGAANVCNVTVQVQDAGGNNLASVFELSLWLSDNATGQGLAAHTPSGTTGQGSAGTELQQKVSKLAFDVLTDATGKYVLQITDTSKTAYFVAGACPGTGVTKIAAQLQTANYG